MRITDATPRPLDEKHGRLRNGWFLDDQRCPTFQIENHKIETHHQFAVVLSMPPFWTYDLMVRPTSPYALHPTPHHNHTPHTITTHRTPHTAHHTPHTTHSKIMRAVYRFGLVRCVCQLVLCPRNSGLEARELVTFERGYCVSLPSGIGWDALERRGEASEGKRHLG